MAILFFYPSFVNLAISMRTPIGEVNTDKIATNVLEGLFFSNIFPFFGDVYA